VFGDEGLGCGIVATYGGLGQAIGAIFVIFKQTHHFLFLLGNKTFYFIFGMNKIHNECSSSVNHRGLFIHKKKKKKKNFVLSPLPLFGECILHSNCIEFGPISWGPPKTRV
jgi:hypothetical protein